eukprot:TRINITY_DN14439_c0_g1_i1.p2 TRINITY_DN14439_c0_g1~~TRINITY_DN14439_c0_g1_i1.p2  ORF type:complete len:239 (+),score=61.39 TRINITY_DN14439_c0_g1_i1:77-718(+)
MRLRCWLHRLPPRPPRAQRGRGGGGAWWGAAASGCFGTAAAAVAALGWAAAEGPAAEEVPSSFYEIREMGADGQEVAFESFRGKVVYGVNVASRCACTAAEYAVLRRLRSEYGGEVVLLAFPCGQFARQELPTDAEVLEFARKHGPEGLVVLTRGDVKGPRMRPTYRLLAAQHPHMRVPWNFQGKFVVDRTGRTHLSTDPVGDLGRLLGPRTG